MTSRQLLIPKMRGSCSCIPSDSSTACSFDPNGVTTEVDCLSDLDNCFCSTWLVSNARLTEWLISFVFGRLWWFKLTLKGGPFRVSSAAYRLQFSEKGTAAVRWCRCWAEHYDHQHGRGTEGISYSSFKNHPNSLLFDATWCTFASVSLLVYAPMQ